MSLISYIHDDLFLSSYPSTSLSLEVNINSLSMYFSKIIFFLDLLFEINIYDREGLVGWQTGETLCLYLHHQPFSLHTPLLSNKRNSCCQRTQKCKVITSLVKSAFLLILHTKFCNSGILRHRSNFSFWKKDNAKSPHHIWYYGTRTSKYFASKALIVGLACWYTTTINSLKLSHEAKHYTL